MGQGRPGLGDTFFISFQRPLCQNPSGNAARNRNLGKLRRDLGSPVWVSDKVALAKCVPSHTIGRGRFRPVREEPSGKPSIILWGDEPQDDPPHELAQAHREKPKLVEESWGEKGCAPPSRPYSCRPTARMAHVVLTAENNGHYADIGLSLYKPNVSFSVGRRCSVFSRPYVGRGAQSGFAQVGCGYFSITTRQQRCVSHLKSASSLRSSRVVDLGACSITTRQQRCVSLDNSLD